MTVITGDYIRTSFVMSWPNSNATRFFTVIISVPSKVGKIT